MNQEWELKGKLFAIVRFDEIDRHEVLVEFTFDHPFHQTVLVVKEWFDDILSLIHPMEREMFFDDSREHKVFEINLLAK